MDPLRPIYNAYDEGRAALFLSGRPLSDLVTDRDAVRTLAECLRHGLRERYGMAFVSYSMAGGLDWDEHRLTDERDRRTLATALRAHGLIDIPQDSNEVVTVIRGISSLSRMSASDLRWTDGRTMRLAFLLEFAEHLTPGGMANGSQTDHQLVAIELAHLTGQSLALRSSGNLVLFHGREGLLDELVCSSLHPVRLPLASKDEKVRFLEAVEKIYPQAKLEEGLTVEDAATLTSNTTNRGVEELLRASQRTGRPATAAQFSERKRRDAQALSEGTLTALDTRRIERLTLEGRNIAAAAAFLRQCAQRLLRGDPSTPSNILLAGAPGTGKTDLALHTAALARVAAYQLHSPKAGIVGETERRALIQQRVSREWTPNVCFIDEISEAMPLERSDFDGDSGASRAVMGAMLTALSDETRRGRSLLIATTNCPWRMGAAMRSRFLVVPVLQPLAEDYPGILNSIARRIDPAFDASPAGDCVQEAAQIFYQKSASPRHIYAALSHAVLLHGQLTAEAARFAALDFSGMTDHGSSIYADLWALQCCVSNSLLPWADNAGEYPFPAHLQGVVDTRGCIQEAELKRRIEQYKAHANV